MLWLRWNAVGLLGLALAVVAATSGAEAYRAGVRRDEQVRAIRLRSERGEADLAEAHRRSVAALGSYAGVTRTVAYRFAVLAVMAGALHATRSRPSLWLTGAAVLLAAGAIVLAHESRAELGSATGGATGSASKVFTAHCRAAAPELGGPAGRGGGADEPS